MFFGISRHCIYYSLTHMYYICSFMIGCYLNIHNIHNSYINYQSTFIFDVAYLLEEIYRRISQTVARISRRATFPTVKVTEIYRAERRTSDQCLTVNKNGSSFQYQIIVDNSDQLLSMYNIINIESSIDI